MLVGEGKPSQIKKWKKQRAERGFSDYDIFEIDTWFLMIMPEMLAELIEHNNNCPTYPSYFQNEYMEEHKLDPFNISDEEQDKMNKYCLNKWKRILQKMKNAFIKSNNHTCFYKNKYDEEYHRLWDPFFETYGHNGERLKGNVKKEQIKDESGKIIQSFYRPIVTYCFEEMSDENKRISNLYHTEQKKIDMSMEKNKRKALELFVQYFDNLWH